MPRLVWVEFDAGSACIRIGFVVDQWINDNDMCFIDNDNDLYWLYCMCLIYVILYYIIWYYIILCYLNYVIPISNISFASDVWNMFVDGGYQVDVVAIFCLCCRIESIASYSFQEPHASDACCKQLRLANAKGNLKMCTPPMHSIRRFWQPLPSVASCATPGTVYRDRCGQLLAQRRVACCGIWQQTALIDEDGFCFKASSFEVFNARGKACLCVRPSWKGNQ